jgi:predicted N-formylglutamate amidohydrolase
MKARSRSPQHRAKSATPSVLQEVVVTVEHASTTVPKELAQLFAGQSKLLRTHRAFDEGARELAEGLAKAWQAPLLQGEYTRLVVDLNRSVGHRGVFSEFTRKLDRTERRRLLQEYHLPYKQAVLEQIVPRLAKGPVLHLSVHSFVPVLHGKVRRVDVGLLLDPQSPLELSLAQSLEQAWQSFDPSLIIGVNTPYRGTSDALVTGLRRWLPVQGYAGLEIELNQRLLSTWQDPAYARGLALALAPALRWHSRR